MGFGKPQPGRMTFNDPYRDPELGEEDRRDHAAGPRSHDEYV